MYWRVPRCAGLDVSVRLYCLSSDLLLGPLWLDACSQLKSLPKRGACNFCRQSTGLGLVADCHVFVFGAMPCQPLACPCLVFFATMPTPGSATVAALGNV